MSVVCCSVKLVAMGRKIDGHSAMLGMDIERFAIGMV